jgi:hypothetical protein
MVAILDIFKMPLAAPKRLFDIDSMETCLHESLGTDVLKKGYVAVTHVWGNQIKYKPEDLGIKGGVNWDVPLSNPDKMDRLINAMKHYKMKYVWFDVICMPQDEPDEINKEVPFMGDYYSGATMTFMLANYVPSTSPNVLNGLRFFGRIVRHVPYPTSELADMEYISTQGAFIDVWYYRKWTFQEAVLSKKIKFIGYNGHYFSLTNIFKILMDKRMQMHKDDKHNRKGVELAYSMKSFQQGEYVLGKALYDACERQCDRQEDKFYGVLGILGYKNFHVEYADEKITLEEKDLYMKALNLRIIKHAYSRNDISWLAVQTENTGIVPQLYEDSIRYIGSTWKKGGCNVAFGDDTLCISACEIAIISDCKARADLGSKWGLQAIQIFREWGFNDIATISAMMGNRELSNSLLGAGVEALKPYNIDGIFDVAIAAKDLLVEASYHAGMTRKSTNSTVRDILNEELRHTDNICKATSNGKMLALIICGRCDIGDKVILLPIYDNLYRALGMIVDSTHRRKGIFLYPGKMVKENGFIFELYKFPL